MIQTRKMAFHFLCPMLTTQKVSHSLTALDFSFPFPTRRMKDMVLSETTENARPYIDNTTYVEYLKLEEEIAKLQNYENIPHYINDI